VLHRTREAEKKEHLWLLNHPVIGDLPEECKKPSRFLKQNEYHQYYDAL
jgi:hypothetical protein